MISLFYSRALYLLFLRQFCLLTKDNLLIWLLLNQCINHRELYCIHTEAEIPPGDLHWARRCWKVKGFIKQWLEDVACNCPLTMQRSKVCQFQIGTFLSLRSPSSEESRMLCQEAAAHQTSVRCPPALSSELTCSFMLYKVVIYVFKIALACDCWASFNWPYSS